MKPVFAALLAFLFLGGCGSSDQKTYLPGRVGPVGEMVVVLPQKYWDSAIVEAIRSITDRPYELLPQAESSVDVALLDPSEFDRFWKPHRNVLVVDLADRVDTQEPSLKVYRNKYASDQIYAEAKGKTADEVAEVIRNQGEQLVRAIQTAELKRVADLVRSNINEALRAEVAENWKLHIDFPRDARKVTENENFLWVQREITRMKGGNNHDIKQGFFVYTYPYESDSVFSFQWQIQKRNDMLYRYVHGQPEGSFMTTEMELIPSYEEVNFDGRFTSEIRGLWKMEKDFMGGPFVMMTFFDEANQRIVTLEGYAYAPYFNKREYIREAEAILKTVKIADAPPKAG
ncbi:MAG: DUF4837 family protein [Flavobacteriales bacterium]